MLRDEILSRLASHADELRAMGVISLGLFGSVARGEERPDSDVDLLVEIRRPAGYLALGRVQLRLEEILGRPVDLVPLKALKPELAEGILAETIRAA
jgi:predicted nucleotidyltransferase